MNGAHDQNQNKHIFEVALDVELVDPVAHLQEQVMDAADPDLPTKTRTSSKNLAEQNAAVTEKSLEQLQEEEIAKNSHILVEMGISQEEQSRRFKGMAPSVVINRQKADIRWWKGFQSMDRKSGIILMEAFSKRMKVDGE